MLHKCVHVPIYLFFKEAYKIETTKLVSPQLLSLFYQDRFYVDVSFKTRLASAFLTVTIHSDSKRMAISFTKLRWGILFMRQEK